MRDRLFTAGLVMALCGSVVVISGCAAHSAAVRSRAVGLTAEQRAEIVRRQGVDPSSVVDPLSITEEMRDFARRHARTGPPLEKLRRLNKALFYREEFKFEYDAMATFTAIEAFESRKGNCVAFTNLFIALARCVGVPVQAGLFRYAGKSERRGDLILVNSHLVAVYPHARGLTVYDFYRSREGATGGLRLLGDLWIEAIYFNNKGVQSLREENVEESLGLFEVAITFAPEFSAAHANLGVARRRAGDIAGAFRAYRTALQIEPRDPAVLGNLAALYRSLGRGREARAALLAADLSSASPFHLITRGDLAMEDGNVVEAIRLYRRAHRLQRDLPDPLLALARAEIARGELRAARRAVEKALKADPASAEARSLKDELARADS
jgi:Tfp pilus assembly protein PilF